jgi:hypothetical protein
MTLEEIVIVVIAAKAGKQIQYQLKDCEKNGRWINTFGPVWNFADHNYRVEPEPDAFWLNIYKTGGVIAYQNEELARDNASDNCIKTIKVQEVPS